MANKPTSMAEHVGESMAVTKRELKHKGKTNQGTSVYN